MTYYGLMKTATISDFKAHISENLRAVKAGEHILILDRATAIAEVIPVTQKPRPTDLQARKKFSIPEPPVLRIKSDANDLLALERGER
jgi:antitoxin (DNA-binding transcriptional repressor) of toxin-antitoxin stability system